MQSLQTGAFQPLNSAVIHAILLLTEHGEAGALASWGVTDRMAHTLINSSTTELAFLLKHAASWIKIQVVNERFEIAFRRASEESEELYQVDKFLLQGASIEMIKRLFGWQSERVIAHRRGIGIRTKCGRVTMPPDNIKMDIQVRWSKLAREPGFDERKALLMMAREFPAWSLTVINGCISSNT